MAEDERREEKVYTAGSQDYVLLSAGYDAWLGESVVNLTVDAGGDDVTFTFDRFHVRELRLALTRLEKWINR